jgi:N-acetylglucosamine malate deacetylase 1
MIDALCIGSHPDDVEIAMGGTIASMLSQKYDVVILDLSDGEPTPFGTHTIRIKEAKQAARSLGIEQRIILNNPNRAIEDTIPAREQLAEWIRFFRPKRIFCPWHQDAHPDHVAASRLVESARFYAKLVKSEMQGEPFFPPHLYYYFPVHQRLHLQPHFVLDISDFLTAKLQAARCFESQFQANPANLAFLETIEIQAKYWGTQIRRAAGEPFRSAETLGCSSLSALW